MPNIVLLYTESFPSFSTGLSVLGLGVVGEEGGCHSFIVHRIIPILLRGAVCFGMRDGG